MGYEDFYQIFPIASPAAGSPVNHRVPGETWEQVKLAHVQFVTSAAVANRQVFLDYLDGDANVFARFEFVFNQAASQTLTYTWCDQYGAGVTPAGADATTGLHAVMMPPGTTVRISAKNIDVADQFSQASLYLCRYPSGDWAESPGATPYRPELIGYAV